MNISRNMFLAALVTFGFNVVASEQANQTTDTSTTTQKVEAEAKGIIAKVGGFIYSGVHLPFDLLDSIAGSIAPAKLTEWQGANGTTTDANGQLVAASFLSKHNVLNRTFAVTLVAAVAALGKLGYDNFVAEDNSDDEDFENVFGEEIASN